MIFFLNELSLHNQFQNLQEFSSSLQAILRCKYVIDRFGFRLYCSRTIINRQVFQGILFSSVILSSMDQNFKRIVRIWLEKSGPFWDNPPEHDLNDYFEYNNEPLENASLAEAVFQIAVKKNKCSTLSFSPSDFEKTPLSVFWYRTDPPQKIDVLNFWELNSLQLYLDQVQSPISSWAQLLERAKDNFPNFVFLKSVSIALEGEAFNSTIAERIVELLTILNKLTTCFDEQGHRTKIGHEIIETYFHGDRAIFSDESSSNKHRFKEELTFRKPDGELIFCPFHGKINYRVFRLHFSWPIRYNEPVYIAHIGPKITKH